MVTHPEQWVDDFAAAGASSLTFHVEAARAYAGLASRNRASLIVLRCLRDARHPIHIAQSLVVAGDTRALIDRVRNAGMKVGLALKPGTPVDAIVPFLDAVDLVLVMSVEPGFGGQSFMPSVLDKVRAIRSLRPEINIQIDGGIGVSNIADVASAGANVIVSGTGIFKHPAGSSDAIAKLRSAVAAATTATTA